MSRAVVEGADAYHIAAEIDFDGRVLARRHLDGRDLDALAVELDSGEKLLAFLEEFGDAVTDQVGDEVDRLEARIREVLPGRITSISSPTEPLERGPSARLAG